MLGQLIFSVIMNRGLVDVFVVWSEGNRHGLAFSAGLGSGPMRDASIKRVIYYDAKELMVIIN